MAVREDLSAGTGRNTWTPFRAGWRQAPDLPWAPAYRRHQYLVIAGFVALAALVLPQAISGTANQQLLDLWIVYSVAVIGFYWVFGLAGRFAFCQTFMMLFGGYVAAWVTRTLGPAWFLLGLVAAMAAAAAAAAVIGLVTARAQDIYFAIGTIAVTEIGLVVFPHFTQFTGPGGTQIDIPPPQIGGLVFSTQKDIFWLYLVIMALTLVVGAFIERSPVMREAIASRDNRITSTTLGIPVGRIQLVLFVLGSAFGGLAGAMAGNLTGSVGTTSFGIQLAIGIFLMLILGGSNSMWGPVLGAAFYVVVPQLLQSFSSYESIVYGGLLLVVIILLPEGLLGLANRVWRRMGGRGEHRVVPPHWDPLATFRRRDQPESPADGGRPIGGDEPA